jgi:hypothetical protein
VSLSPERAVAAGLLARSYLVSAQLAVWEAVCGRPVTAYSSIAPQLIPHGRHLPAQRAALWSSGRHTIEWRHPAGTTDPRVALARVELLADLLAHASEHAARNPGRSWGWGLYLRDRPAPTPATRYAWAFLRSLGY